MAAYRGITVNPHDACSKARRLHEVKLGQNKNGDCGNCGGSKAGPMSTRVTTGS